MALFASKETFFEILDLAGEGLNSRVYKALRKDASGSISQVVALKILKSKNAVPFWRQEVQSLLQVNSPHCVRVLDFEWVGNHPALVLEWFEGVTLTHLYENCLLTEAEALEVALQVQEGLVDLHCSHLCHGDLHMDNIFIEKSGEIKLLDFGMANVSRYKSQGNPRLRAPELETDNSPSFWSDLYSLGILCNELGLTHSNLCHSDPNQRDLLPGKKSLKSKMSLAEKVNSLLKRKEFTSTQKTLCLSPDKDHPFKNPFKLLSSLIVFSLFLALNPSRANHRSCLLEIKTKNWHLVQVNNSEQRYAPTSFLLKSCKDATIHWQSANGQGDLIVNSSSALHVLLKDEDFFLDH